MEVIPSINCADFEGADGEVRIASGFLPPGGWLHLDVADGIFTFHKSWNDSRQFQSLALAFPQFSWEIHLMVTHPESVAEAWLVAGAKRLIIHLEVITPETAAAIIAMAQNHSASVMLASNPETKSESLTPYLQLFSEFQVLAVTPGWAGQQFLPVVLDKVKFLRQQCPNALLEVDGGINPHAADLVKAVGANQIVAASYLFDAADKASAFKQLSSV